MNISKLVVVALFLLGAPSRAGDGHKGHKPGEKHDEAPAKEAGPAEEGHDAGEKHGEHGQEHGEEDEEPNPNVGPGKGVEAFGHEGMKLSAKAAANLGLKTSAITGSGAIKAPASALVFSRDEVGVYRVRGGWIKLVDVALVERTRREAVIRSSELKPGDGLVVSGAAAVRVIELDLTSGDAGHGH